ncbi:helix-turn-helix domain-containing protein [Nonomuraea soli]|uniref:PucR family transcriptional regulator n=1 Tax=Nonomuraea soli TaxID=1032476 RepID=A0A7W0CDG1_9ACTN|nr:PucR family transcriptional regulator [Nonomuraea soli]MBA2889114.1 hypothetical protein [Nonomuraea soli]
MTVVTARDLLNDPAFHGYRLLGGASGLDHVVRNAAQIQTGADLSRIAPGSVGVTDLGDRAGVSAQHLVEVFCRRLHGRGGRMLVIVGNVEAATQSTIRLADRFGLPLVAVAPTSIPASAAALTARLLGLVQQPELLYARAMAGVVSKLVTADTLERVVAIAAEALRGTAAVVAAEGRIVSGGLRWATPEQVTRHATITTERLPDHAWASCPVPGSGHRLWLVAETADGGPAWQEAARAVTQTAAVAAGAWVAHDRLRQERDRARLAGLLTELLQLEGAPVIPEHVARRAARAGIVLDGWHVGVHLTWGYGGEQTSADLTPQLTSALEEEGFALPVFERADGWSSWVTSPERPSEQEVGLLAARLRKVLAWFNAAYAENRSFVPLAAGVGRPATGPAAVAATLGQAHQAALTAASDGPGVVEHIDDVGPEQLMWRWFTTEAFREQAARLLAPVLAAPDSGMLLRTLDAYLTCGSSPGETAKAIGLHRNTVTQRITVLERLLGGPVASLDRLALHLACRSLTAGASRTPGGGHPAPARTPHL